MSRSRERRKGERQSFSEKRVRLDDRTHPRTLVPEEIAFCGLPPPLPRSVIKREQEGRVTHDRRTLTEEVNQI